MFPQTVWGSVRCSVNGAAMMTPRTLEETCYTQVPIHCGHCYTTQEMLPYRVPSEKVLSLGRPGWHVFPCSPAGTLSCWSPVDRMKPLYSSTPSGHCSGWGEPCVPHRLNLGMTGKASWLAGHVVQGVAVSVQVWWPLQLQAGRNS